MTLIATVQLNGGSALIGDLLVTRPRLQADPDEYVLPIGRTRLGVAPALSPVAYMQKILVLHPRVALAWTGPVTRKLSAVLATMRRVALSGEGDPDQIQNAMQRLEREGKLKGMSLICIAVDTENVVHTILFGAVARPDIPGLHAAVAGSGKNQFLEVLHRMWGDGAPFVGAYGAHLGLAAVLVAALTDLEAVHKITTPVGYGGGYELIYWTGQEFVKCDGLVVTKAVLQLDPEGFALFPPVAHVATRYDGDDLLISALVPDPLKAETYTPLGIYARSPERRHLPKRPAHSPIFSGRVHALSIDILWEDRFVCLQTHFSGAEPAPITVQLTPDGKRVGMRWESAFESQMADLAKDAIRTRFPQARFGNTFRDLTCKTAQIPT